MSHTNSKLISLILVSGSPPHIVIFFLIKFAEGKKQLVMKGFALGLALNHYTTVEV